MSFIAVTRIFSIRQKLVMGVAVIILLMAAAFLATFYWMRSFQEKIGNLETVSRLEESVLEMRRFEKNFFLYGDVQSLRTAQYNADRVRHLLDKQESLFRRLSDTGSLETFRSDLTEYARLLTDHMKQCADKDKCFPMVGRDEVAIRQSGAAIADFAERLSSRKRASIHETVRNTVKLQLASFALAGIGIAVMGGLMFVKITGPLKLLDESTRRIAKGEFEPIEVIPAEKEVRDIFLSFNQMARELKQGQDQLVQSKKLASLGTMLAGVAHEINNPLSNISSCCQLLLEEIDDPDPEFQKISLETILEQVDKARNIVRTLLEFSRNREFCIRRIRLKELLEKTLMLLQGDIPTQVRVVTEIDDTIVVHVDIQRMQQALINLISNAIQAIEGEGTVEISAGNGRDGMVDIVVRDSGKGIPQEDLPRIFDPFFTTKDVGEGTGLGLFVTHDIVTSHQGTITIDTGRERGTAITISIPKERLPTCPIEQEY
ncbi:MAG: ATP-binding protein [Pseudomonadota bacterium]